MTGVVITSDVLEGYLNCKYLAHLRLRGDEGTKTDYENLLLRDRFEQRLAAAAKIQALYNKQIVSTDIALSRDKLREGASFILNAQLYDEALHIHFDGLKKVDGSSELGAFHYVPILLSGTRKVRKNDRLLLEILGLIASRIQGREPRRGVVYHGPTCLATSVGFSAGLTQGKAALHELRQMQQGTAVPKLLLNDHCRICEFRSRCHAQAVKEDNLTLLRGIGEKDLKRYARRGLFTLTQIVHTFRPRRRGKRSPPLRVRDHALHALAIRDKTVYVFGTPDVPSSVSEIYLDIEGKPDGRFVYLIGIVICAQDRQERYSFWADTREEERIIFDQLIAELSKHPDAKIFCYGAYERTFLKRMRETARRKKIIDLILNSLVNVLSLVYAHFYFPTYSNGLKDIGALLGCSWADEHASGIQSAVWRVHWEKSRDESWKTKLIEYNLEDCDALHKLVKFLRTTCKEISNSTEYLPMENHSGLRITPVKDLERASYTVRWQPFVQPDLAFVNKHAYFDYQRQRVFIRGNKVLRRRYRAAEKNRNRTIRASQRVQFTASRCPKCGSDDLIPIMKRRHSMGPSSKRKRAFDLRITEAGIRRWVIDCRATMYHCRACGYHFVPHQHHRLARHFRGCMSWIIYLQVAHGMSTGSIQRMFYDLFALRLSGSDIMMIRTLMARYYRPTYNRLIRTLVSGGLLHADETEVRLRTGKGYVWVFTSAEEVAYMYRPTRDGTFLQKMLEGFLGVLVTDFYPPYNALSCSQQKCLVHLMRDMNQDILSNPFDIDLRFITDQCGRLLRAIVSTIDKHGLKRSHLQGHSTSVEMFLQSVAGHSFHSEAARALQNRIVKNRDKLFTFVDRDGIPWNNNNAEFAVKQFSYFRDDTAKFMKDRGLSDYLVLLSVYQTCRYKGINFLKFLLSGVTNFETFPNSKRNRRRNPVELYPRGFEPTHLARMHRLNESRRKQHAHQQASPM